MRMFRVIWYVWFWSIACCPQHQSPTAQATGHWSKMTFHYTQRAPPTVHPFTPLKQIFHNVLYISSEVDSVNDYYAIYRRYKMDLLPLHINMDTWHLCKVSPSVKLAVSYRHLKEMKNRQRWKRSSVKQFFKKEKTLWTNKRAWIHFFFFVRPANLAYDWKKALPSQPAQTWRPLFMSFPTSPSHRGGETLNFRQRLSKKQNAQ